MTIGRNSPTGFSWASGTSFGGSVDVGTGDRRYIIAAVRTFDSTGTAVTASATIAGHAMSVAVYNTYNYAGTLNIVTYIFYYGPISETGSQTLTINLSAAPDTDAYALAWTESDCGGIGANTATGSGNTTAPSLTFTTGASTSKTLIAWGGAASRTASDGTYGTVFGTQPSGSEELAVADGAASGGSDTIDMSLNNSVRSSYVACELVEDLGGGGGSYEIVGSGGLVTGGAGPVVAGRVEAGSGGLVTAGAAAIAAGFILAAAGGLVSGGAATISYAHNYEIVASGGAVSGGAADIQAGAVITPSGGAVFGGAADIVGTHAGGASYEIVGSGGLVSGGASDILFGFLAPTSGGLVSGGAADFVFNYEVVASGGLVSGGSADIATGYIFSPSGSLVSGGAADLAFGFVLTPSGGLVSGGSAPITWTGYVSSYEIVGSGGLVFGGSAGFPTLYPGTPKLLVCINTSETWEEHFVNNSWTTIQDQIDAGYPIYAEPVPLTATYQEIIDYGTVLGSIVLNMDWTIEEISGGISVSPAVEFSSDGITWSSPVYGKSVFGQSVRYVRITLTFTGTDDKSLAKFSNFQIFLDVKREMDSGDLIANAADAGGTEVTFNKAFKDVDSITVTAESLEPLTTIYDFVDAPDPVSFFVYVFDSAGQRITYPVSWKARGIV